MKRFNVYGIGNALVDMEYEVDETFLNSLSIEKGLMTLIDKKKQDELLDALDGKSSSMTSGGSAANTMIAIRQFGGKSFYSCKVSNDDYGQFYANDLKHVGVESNLESCNYEGVTGKCVVLITPDADRTMNSFLGITETFSVSELREEEIKNSEYLYIEGYLVTSETGRAAAVKAREIAKDNGVKVSLTFSDPGMVTYFGEGLTEIMGGKIDLLFCNEDEANSFAKTTNVEDSIEKMKEVAECFAITLGPKGALIYDGNELIKIEGKSVKAVNTNGAGDLFAGAFLYGITSGLSFEKAGELACVSSARLVTKFGARLEQRDADIVKKEVLGE